MLVVLVELIVGLLIGVLEFLGDAIFEGICEVVAKLPVLFWAS